MRFIHAADFHLGKPFGRFDEDTRAALRAARLGALQATADYAVAQDIPYVLIAGDTFDAETPPTKLVKRALDVMAGAGPVTWVWMPGNHDSGAAVDLWERIARDKPDNVVLALTPDPILLGEGLAVLPAPPMVRAPGHDLTDWMTDADTGGRLRVGLAHGGVTDFGSEDGGLATIPPNRAELSGLDYLALGDWHGQKQITPRTWYAGTPEADGFKGHAPAGVLDVMLTTPGAAPQVTPVPLGQYQWHKGEVAFFSGSDPVQVLEQSLPAQGRDRALVTLQAAGTLTLSELADLRAACARVGDDFHAFDADLTRINIAQNLEDLDAIATGGALRVAAEALFTQTTPEGRTQADARIAQAALAHLFQLARKAKP